LAQVRGGCDEVLGRQLIGSRSWAINNCRQAASLVKVRAVIFWTDFFGREAGETHDAPKAISSSRKVVTSGCCIHSRIDPAERHRETFKENVGEPTGHRRIRAFRRRQA
jgi:hypothetical protein